MRTGKTFKALLGITVFPTLLGRGHEGNDAQWAEGRLCSKQILSHCVMRLTRGISFVTPTPSVESLSCD